MAGRVPFKQRIDDRPGSLICAEVSNEQGVSYVYYTQLYDAIYNWGTSGRRSGPASGVGQCFRFFEGSNFICTKL